MGESFEIRACDSHHPSWMLFTLERIIPFWLGCQGNSADPPRGKQKLGEGYEMILITLNLQASPTDDVKIVAFEFHFIR